MSLDPRIVRTDSADEVLLTVSGEVDLSWSQQLRLAVLDAVKQAAQVSVDLAQVGYIDSSGIAALVEGLQVARSRKRQLILKRPSTQVRAVLELSRLDQVFVISP